jgi:hypothetical protein
MPENNEETTDTSTTETTTETTETVEEQARNSAIEEALQGLGDTPSEPNETVEETETETGEETENETQETNNDFLLEAKIENDVEKFDLKDEKQRSKAIEYIQKGRHYEKRMHEVNEQEKLVKQLNDSIGYNYLSLIAKGDVPVAKPIFNELAEGNGKAVLDDDGKTVLYMEYNDRKECAKAELKYEKLLQAKQNFGLQLQQTYKSYKEMKSKFEKNHPDTNIEEFEKNVVDPIYNSLTSFGAKEIPNDLFEMLYFGANRQKIIKDEVDKALKNYVKKPTVKTVNKSGASPSTRNDKEKMADLATQGLGDEDKKIRFR